MGRTLLFAMVVFSSVAGGLVKLKHRLAILGFGLLTSLYGRSLMHRGILEYKNQYSQTAYSSGLVALGLFLCGVALLPPASVVNWILRNKKGR